MAAGPGISNPWSREKHFSEQKPAPASYSDGVNCFRQQTHFEIIGFSLSMFTWGFVNIQPAADNLVTQRIPPLTALRFLKLGCPVRCRDSVFIQRFPDFHIFGRPKLGSDPAWNFRTSGCRSNVVSGPAGLAGPAPIGFPLQGIFAAFHNHQIGASADESPTICWRFVGS